jgi:predicted Zn-dependent peptidase
MGYNLLMISRVIEDDDIINNIKAITLEDVIAVSKKYLRLDEMSFTAVGKVKDKAEYEKILESAIKK